MPFDSFSKLAGAFAATAVELEHHARESMNKACEVLENSAKGALGTYEFGWPPLAASTLDRKGADTPLLETGELRDSIGHTLESPKIGWVGTNDPKAAWHEFGTSRIPARPFLGGAVNAKGKEVSEVFGKKAIEVLEHKSPT